MKHIERRQKGLGPPEGCCVDLSNLSSDQRSLTKGKDFLFLLQDDR